MSGFGSIPVKKEGGELPFDSLYNKKGLPVEETLYYERAFTKRQYQELAQALAVAAKHGAGSVSLQGIERELRLEAKDMK